MWLQCDEDAAAPAQPVSATQPQAVLPQTPSLRPQRSRNVSPLPTKRTRDIRTLPPAELDPADPRPGLRSVHCEVPSPLVDALRATDAVYIERVDQAESIVLLSTEGSSGAERFWVPEHGFVMVSWEPSSPICTLVVEPQAQVSGTLNWSRDEFDRVWIVACGGRRGVKPSGEFVMHLKEGECSVRAVVERGGLVAEGPELELTLSAGEELMVDLAAPSPEDFRLPTEEDVGTLVEDLQRADDLMEDPVVQSSPLLQGMITEGLEDKYDALERADRVTQSDTAEP